MHPVRSDVDCGCGPVACSEWPVVPVPWLAPVVADIGLVTEWRVGSEVVQSPLLGSWNWTGYAFLHAEVMEMRLGEM